MERLRSLVNLYIVFTLLLKSSNKNFDIFNFVFD